MCGRFAAFSSADEIADRLALSVISAGARLLPPNWNVAPTQTIKVLVPGEALTLDVARWGLQTPWNRSGSGIINARVESVTEKPSFSSAFAERRCIVPVDGYYEWQKTANGKQPWYITGPDQALYFAGIYNVYPRGFEAALGSAPTRQAPQPREGLELSVAILTMAASSEINQIHHRMPVSFSDEYLTDWVFGSPSDALALLNDADNHFDKWEISTMVNSVRNNGPTLLKPVEPEATLF